MQANNYWSSSTNASNPNNAWNVNFNNGNVDANNKTNNNYVWPVRLESDSEVNAKTSKWSVFASKFISPVFKMSAQ